MKRYIIMLLFFIAVTMLYSCAMKKDLTIDKQSYEHYQEPQKDVVSIIKITF